jgi:hypothetical protein
MPQYQYRLAPLGSNRIRLLHLRPSEDETASINGQLCEYPLENSDQRTHLYEALSYVWGSSNKPRSIFIEGCDLPITENLYTALSRLRNCSLERIIWVDSVCINQEDIQEKERQIQLMAKIYGQANCVIVYLGEAADNSNQALEDIRIAATNQSKSLFITETRREAVFKLLERPWFQRIWVSYKIVNTIYRRLK